ncbi:MAG: asparagine synthase-related protein, partial [Planctomycetota bacterium]
MCGIGGIVRVTPAGEEPEHIPEHWLDLLDAHIAWRGPDGHGRFRDTAKRADGTTVEVGFVHRRLSIIDHTHGTQPMVSEYGPGLGGPREGRIAVVFNGCIYNHNELREELEARGHLFLTDHSDTEVLLHGYRQWGLPWFGAGSDEDPTMGSFQDLLDYRLEGMYAFGLWDRTHGRVVVRRDDYHRKPLYIWRGPSGISAFASTAPALRALRDAVGGMATDLKDVASRNDIVSWTALGALGRAPDLPHFNRATVLTSSDTTNPGPPRPAPPGVRAILGILAFMLTLIGIVVALALVLVASTILVVAAVAVVVLIPIIPAAAFRSLGLLTKAPNARTLDDVEHLIERAVVDRLEADVPLGCFLSGGIDSSLIALYASKHAGRITTLCVRMPDERYDESEHAERVARQLGTSHITVECAADPASDLVHIIETLGLPFGDSSILPTYWLCKAAREHMTVALSGDGGDELFCGYERYKAAAWLGATRWLPARIPERL